MIFLQDYRSTAKGLADLLPYAAQIENGIILNKDGSFLAAWTYEGKDTESVEQHDLDLQAERFNRACMTLGTGWMLHIDSFRTPRDVYSPEADSHFPDPVTKMIEAERRSRFSADTCYVSATYLALTYKPDFLATKLAGKAKEGVDADTAMDKALIHFKQCIAEFEDSLSAVFSMFRLNDYPLEDIDGEKYIQSHLLSYLQRCVSGVLQPIRLPDVPMYIDSLIGSEPLIGGIAPRLGDKCMAILALDGLPLASYPCMLRLLDQMALDYRWSTRAIFLDKYDAEKEADLMRKAWTQQVVGPLKQLFGFAGRVNRDALAMEEDAEQAKTEIQSGFVGACYLTANIILMDEDPERLQDNARALRRELRTIGFGSRIENINCVEAWLGTLPSVSHANLRRPLVSTLNLAHLVPLSTPWRGNKNNPCPFYPLNSPPLSVVTTDYGATPFWFNVHVNDIGHTLIFGPSGTGKSTLLVHIANQFFRYRNAQIFAFDKGLSMFPLNLAAKGLHYDIGSVGGQAFAPLRSLETPEDMAFASEWIAMLMELQRVMPLPEHKNAIHEGLTRLSGNASHLRGLTEFYNIVPHEEVRNAIRHYTVQGTLGHLLDARDDTLGFSHFTVFELENLMNMGEANLIPVLTYIFWRIEKALTGNPTLLILDEAWIMLGHPAFRAKIREWLKVLRKKNCGVILATQSLSDAKNSGIIDILTETCPTKILLANSAARQVDQSELYRDIGCNPALIDLISYMTPKQDYLLLQPDGRRVIQLALGRKELAFAVSDPDSISKIKELHAQLGDGWVDEWLRIRRAT